MKTIEFVRQAFSQRAARLGLENAKIHSSALLTLGLISFLFLAIGMANSENRELRTVAVTLPVVWCISIAIRVAAQQLSLGPYSHEVECIIGPTGNLATDYEYLPRGRLVAYATTGQLATVGMASLGLAVSAATIPIPSNSFLWSDILDFRGGWGNAAWATQITWVNLFLFGLHLLPTVPFDMRAAMFAFFARKSSAQEPGVLQKMALMDSHLAMLCVGAGGTLILFGWLEGDEVVGCTGAIAAAIYLLVASKWEATRAVELQQQYSPLPTRLVRADTSHAVSKQALEYPGDAIDPSEAVQVSSQPSEPDFDIDEILRKLHRKGRDGLSSQEQNALLLASERLKRGRNDLGNDLD